MAWRLRAGLTSLLVPPLLELVSFARIERALDVLARLAPTGPVDPDALARWVDRLLGRLPRPWAFTCLRRATVLYHLLRAAGLPIALCIGVRRDLDGSLHAHAWLLREGVLFLEPARIAERVASFSEIARFPTGAPPARPAWVKPRDDLTGARLLLDTLGLGTNADAAVLAGRWERADAGALVTLAKYEGAELWLARRLRTLGISLTGAAAAALDAAASRARARNLRADAALTAVLEAFRATQVECVLLKSAALRRLTSRLPLADARASADVDLLVPEAEGDHALGVLRARGWNLVSLPGEALGGDEARPRPGERETLRAMRAVAPPHHLPSVADRTGVAIELHLSTGPLVRPMEAWRRAMSERATVTIDGVSAVVPSDSWLLVHAVAHALGDTEESARAGLRLRYWLDGALLIAGGQIRWDTVRERIESGELGPPRLARTWLWTAAELAGLPAGLDQLGRGDLAALQLDRMLAWRLHVLKRHDAAARWGRKLLEEGARIEAGLGAEMPWKPESLGVRIRRRSARWAARAAWWWWRARS